MSTIKLQSADDEVLEVDVSVANLSSIIQKEIGDSGMVGQSAKSFSSEILRKVEEFCTHHDEYPTPLISYPNPVIPEWDLEFFDQMNDLTLSSVVKAGMDLDIQILKNYGFIYVTKRITQRRRANEPFMPFIARRA